LNIPYINRHGAARWPIILSPAALTQSSNSPALLHNDTYKLAQAQGESAQQPMQDQSTSPADSSSVAPT